MTRRKILTPGQNESRTRYYIYLSSVKLILSRSKYCTFSTYPSTVLYYSSKLKAWNFNLHCINMKFSSSYRIFTCGESRQVLERSSLFFLLFLGRQRWKSPIRRRPSDFSLKYKNVGRSRFSGVHDLSRDLGGHIGLLKVIFRLRPNGGPDEKTYLVKVAGICHFSCIGSSQN